MKSFLFALLLSFLCIAQTAADSRVLQPPRKDLVAVHWPDLTTVEDGVREQIQKLQTTLAATAKDSTSSDTELSAAYSHMGQIYHAYSLISPARECYLNAHRLVPKDFRWIYLLAKLDQQQGSFEEAIRNYRVARALRPDYIAASVNLGNTFLELDRLPEAEESFRAGLAIEENNPAAHYGLGQIAASRRNYSEAVKHFEQTLAQLPGATRVHYSLAMAYRGLGNSEKAKAHLAKQGPVGVGVTDPLVTGLQDLIHGERLFLSRGKRAFEAQQYADAVAEFRKAVAAKSDSVTARINLGAALTQTGDLKGAAEQFEEAIRIEPDKANAHYNLAVVMARQNKHDEAIAHLRTALKVEAGDLTARYLLAQELLKTDRVDDALVEFSQVVQADPNNEGALIEQVKLLYRKGKFKHALDAIRKSHAQFPQKGRTAVILAYLLATSPELELRDGARAFELAQRVYKTTGAPQHAALVALSLAELGRCDEAVEWQRRAVEAADQAGNADLKTKLRADLKSFEASSCRPKGDASLTFLDTL